MDLDNLRVITDFSEFQALCEQLLDCPVISMDTEFMRDKTYYPKLSLIQIAYDNFAVVIDVLAIKDITPLSALMLSKDIVKVFHAARQDMEILWYELNIVPQNIFDTQIAAAFIGFGSQVSLETLAKELLDIKIDKSLQFSNWLERPLSRSQLEYAINDAIMLLAIYSKILSILVKENRIDWVLEDCVTLCNSKLVATVEDLFLRLGLQFKNDKHANICYNTLVWREEIAKKLDLPRGYVIKDERVIMLPNRKISSLASLKKAGNVHRAVTSEQLQQLFDIILDKVTELPMHLKQLLEKRRHSILAKNNNYILLKKLLDKVAKDHDLPAEIIATSSDLLQLAHDLPSRVMRSWRYQLFGYLVEQGQHLLLEEGGDE